MKTYRLRNVLIYDASADVVDKPYFELTTYYYNQNLNKDVAIDYKVSLGFLLEHNKADSLKTKLSKEKVAYDNLKVKIFKAIHDYDPSLLDRASSILFRILYIYSVLVEIDYEQYYMSGSEHSLRIAKPLAELYSIVHRAKKRQAANGNRGVSKDIAFRIGVEEVRIEATDFTDWVLEIIEKSLLQGKYDLDFGANMIEVEDAIRTGDFEKLNLLAKHSGHSPLIEHSRFLTSFCLNIHNSVCAYSNVDTNKFTSKQKKLYSTVSRLLDVPKWDKYTLKDKLNKDSFTKLLIRGMSDMIVVK